MHLVMSAKSGTDATAFRETAREVLASEFAGHEYFFAVHSDRGHLHAHAVILVKGTDGQRIRPDISTFSAWRSRYAEIAKAHGINMAATRRSDTASPPAFDHAEAALSARGVAPEHIRRKVEAKRTNAIHVPVREEGRRRVNEAYQDWKVAETKATTPQTREAVSDNLTRLAAAVNLSHSSKGRAIARLPIEERGAIMVRATGDYLSAEFNRANQVLNRALPVLEGADKVQATQLANAYLSSLAKQVEAVQAVEAGHVVERAHEIHVREERELTDAAEKAGVLRATARRPSAIWVATLRQAIPEPWTPKRSKWLPSEPSARPHASDPRPTPCRARSKRSAPIRSRRHRPIRTCRERAKSCARSRNSSSIASRRSVCPTRGSTADRAIHPLPIDRVSDGPEPGRNRFAVRHWRSARRCGPPLLAHPPAGLSPGGCYGSFPSFIEKNRALCYS